MAAVPTLSETASSACGAAVVSVVAGARISDGREMRGGGGGGAAHVESVTKGLRVT